MTEPRVSELQATESLSTSPPVRKTPWAWTIATFFGAGYWKHGPGTAGSVAAAAIWLLTGYIGSGRLSLAALSCLTAGAGLALLLIGIPASTIVARESGRKDPPFVVADEAVGQWITLVLCPSAIRYAVFGLVLFRLFDIWKPFPIRSIERLPEGWGIMFDDVAAGIYAWVGVQLIRHWLQ
ncbi:MAG: phosphatidylglycerophosphatase A [Acetobacteraceae bacterium]|nr:phosphatidylglycerophosphatase A [Acetobacteraceae bacterium]